MWVFTSMGFVSAVVHREKPGFLMVRARKAEHLRALFPALEINQTEAADYRYRIVVTKKHFAEVLYQAVEDMQYANFKDSIPDVEYHDACLKVWRAMHEIQPGSFMPPEYHLAELGFDDEPGEEDYCPLEDRDPAFTREGPKRMEQYEINRDAGLFSGMPPGFGGAT